MATDPDDIRLGTTERVRLAQIADDRGAKWTDVIAELLEHAESIVGIQRGLNSAAAGEGVSGNELHRELRNKFDL